MLLAHSPCISPSPQEIKIAVIESTVVLQTAGTSNPSSRAVFNVIAQDNEKYISLIRFIPDFIEFNQRIKAYYPRIRLTLPTLSDPNVTKRSSLRLFLGGFLIKRHKTNARKIECYLQQCIEHPLLRFSSLLCDFLSVQRAEDAMSRLTLYPSPVSSVSPVPSLTFPTVTMTTLATTLPETLATTEATTTAVPAMPAMPTMPTMPTMPAISTAPATPPLVMGEEETLQMKDFTLVKVLGKGCMGKVLLARNHQSHKLYALKAISKAWAITQRETEHTRAERDVLAAITKLRHPFLVHLHFSFQNTHQLFLVLDYHRGGDLATHLTHSGYFIPDRCLLYTAEILLGLQALHRLGIVYRDLKPENILLAADGHVVLTDFGLSKQFHAATEHQRTHTFCGTPDYLAPEILKGQAYSYAVDYWSLGTLLYEMLTGTPPFWAEPHSEMYRRIMEDPLEFPTDMDPITADLLQGLLERNPLLRLGTGRGGDAQIRSHPYFSCLDWSDVYHRRISPVYMPTLASETDMRYVDPEFAAMSPRLSVPDSSASMDEACQQVFEGYSYLAESRLSMSDLVSMADSLDPPTEWTGLSLEHEMRDSHSYLLFIVG
ncbi:kinase-like domain-containing protein [Spinellus fusiger]|nr:kinase-like domain-containing protein [Spinellus fusiger]